MLSSWQKSALSFFMGWNPLGINSLFDFDHSTEEGSASLALCKTYRCGDPFVLLSWVSLDEEPRTNWLAAANLTGGGLPILYIGTETFGLQHEQGHLKQFEAHPPNGTGMDFLHGLSVARDRCAPDTTHHDSHTTVWLHPHQVPEIDQRERAPPHPARGNTGSHWDQAQALLTDWIRQKPKLSSREDLSGFPGRVVMLLDAGERMCLASRETVVRPDPDQRIARLEAKAQ